MPTANEDSVFNLPLSGEGQETAVYIRNYGGMIMVIPTCLHNDDKPSPHELGKHLFGRYGSERDDLSITRKAILREKLNAKHPTNVTEFSILGAKCLPDRFV